MTKIAYLGPIGTYSHKAALTLFPSVSDNTDTVLVPYSSLEQLVDAIIDDNDTVTACVVPIENRIIGLIPTTVNRIMHISDRICIGSKELYLPISHCLVTDGSNTDHAEFNKDRIKRIYSHAEAFKQCMRYIADTFGSDAIELVKCGSTADAARLCAQDQESCAICSVDVLQYYPNLKVVVKGIQDVQDNWTRFIVLRRRQDIPFSSRKVFMVTPISYSLALFEIIKKHSKELLSCYSFQGKVLVECTTDLQFSSFLRLDLHVCIIGYIETHWAQ